MGNLLPKEEENLIPHDQREAEFHSRFEAMCSLILPWCDLPALRVLAQVARNYYIATHTSRFVSPDLIARMAKPRPAVPEITPGQLVLMEFQPMEKPPAGAEMVDFFAVLSIPDMAQYQHPSQIKFEWDVVFPQLMHFLREDCKATEYLRIISDRLGSITYNTAATMPPFWKRSPLIVFAECVLNFNFRYSDFGSHVVYEIARRQIFTMDTITPPDSYSFARALYEWTLVFSLHGDPSIPETDRIRAILKFMFDIKPQSYVVKDWNSWQDMEENVRAVMNVAGLEALSILPSLNIPFDGKRMTKMLISSNAEGGFGGSRGLFALTHLLRSIELPPADLQAMFEEAFVKRLPQAHGKDIFEALCKLGSAVLAINSEATSVLSKVSSENEWMLLLKPLLMVATEGADDDCARVLDTVRMIHTPIKFKFVPPPLDLGIVSALVELSRDAEASSMVEETPRAELRRLIYRLVDSAAISCTSDMPIHHAVGVVDKIGNMLTLPREVHFLLRCRDLVLEQATKVLRDSYRPRRRDQLSIGDSDAPTPSQADAAGDRESKVDNDMYMQECIARSRGHENVVEELVEGLGVAPKVLHYLITETDVSAEGLLSLLKDQRVHRDELRTWKGSMVFRNKVKNGTINRSFVGYGLRGMRHTDELLLMHCNGNLDQIGRDLLRAAEEQPHDNPLQHLKDAWLHFREGVADKAKLHEEELRQEKEEYQKRKMQHAGKGPGSPKNGKDRWLYPGEDDTCSVVTHPGTQHGMSGNFQQNEMDTERHFNEKRHGNRFSMSSFDGRNQGPYGLDGGDDESGSEHEPNHRAHYREHGVPGPHYHGHSPYGPAFDNDYDHGRRRGRNQARGHSHNEPHDRMHPSHGGRPGRRGAQGWGVDHDMHQDVPWYPHETHDREMFQTLAGLGVMGDMSGMSGMSGMGYRGGMGSRGHHHMPYPMSEDQQKIVLSSESHGKNVKPKPTPTEEFHKDLNDALDKGLALGLLMEVDSAVKYLTDKAHMRGDGFCNMLVNVLGAKDLELGPNTNTADYKQHESTSVGRAVRLIYENNPKDKERFAAEYRTFDLEFVPVAFLAIIRASHKTLELMRASPHFPTRRDELIRLLHVFLQDTTVNLDSEEDWMKFGLLLAPDRKWKDNVHLKEEAMFWKELPRLSLRMQLLLVGPLCLTDDDTDKFNKAVAVNNKLPPTLNEALNQRLVTLMDPDGGRVRAERPAADGTAASPTTPSENVTSADSDNGDGDEDENFEYQDDSQDEMEY